MYYRGGRGAGRKAEGDGGGGDGMEGQVQKVGGRKWEREAEVENKKMEMYKGSRRWAGRKAIRGERGNSNKCMVQAPFSL